jgi:hypothetical protein
MDDKVLESAVGDIHVPSGTKSAPVDASFEFTPQNPFTIDIPAKEGQLDSNVANPGYPIEPPKTGVLKTAVAEFQEMSSAAHLLHWANRPLTKPANMQVQYFMPDVNDKFYHPAPDGWSPKQEVDKLSDDVDPRFLPKLLASKNPDDFNYTLQSIKDEATRTQLLQNGSTLGKILGGALGLTIGSPENFIPLTALASKAKMGAGFISGMLRTFPGILAASAIHEGANQIDKVEGNLPDFLKDTFIDTAFGTTIFGLAGAGKAFLNMSEFSRLKQFARESLDGVGFNFKVDKKGNLTGFEAVDASGGGSLSAAKVTKAQELADAAFHKGGLYKVPVIGEAAANLLSGNVGNLPGIRQVPILKNSLNYLFGSPLMILKTSDYPEANAFADAFDHYITTEGEAKGIIRPKSFESKVKQTRAMLTALKAQTDALHAERNGYTITARPTLNIQNAWSAIKQKSIQTFSKESNKTDYIGREDFMDEIQKVLYSGESSEHAAVNNAAAIYRKVIDNTWADYRKAYGLPENWMPPKTAESYLMRVYDTAFMNDNEDIWMGAVSKWLRDSDATITERMQPIHDLTAQIKEFEAAHTEAVKELGRRESVMNPGTELVPYTQEVGPGIKTYQVPEQKRLTSGVKEIPDQRTGVDNEHVMTLANMRQRLKTMKEDLQNELRNNPELNIHVEDSHALSADEGKELKTLLEPLNNIKKEIEKQKSVVADLKSKRSRQLSSSKKSETVEKAKPKAQKYVVTDEEVTKAEEALHDLNNKLSDEDYRLYSAARNGEVNPRLYYPENFKFKDPNDRLKFRDVYDNDISRANAAKAYYNSIMHLRPEDTVADVFGKVMGNGQANPLKKRTLMIPDEILYNNNFLTKDLYSKTANYVNYLSRRTHLKTSFDNVTVNGNFEELAEGINQRYESRRSVINQKIVALKEKRESATGKQLKSIDKDIAAEKKNLKKEAVNFDSVKKTMKQLFENRMMGLNKREDVDLMARRSWMSITAAANLHNLPATQITDLAWGGFQHGIWPYVRDGIYPIIESMGGILKTKDAEAMREMAKHLNLGYQDMLNNYADRNWHSELQPYINMGKIVNGIEKFSHFSALTDLSPYIDNGIQRAHGSAIQSKFMSLLHKQLDGTLSEKDSLYLTKYGIDAKQWAERMVNAYKEAEGFQTKLGGYISKSWKWQDLEASNVFNDAVFKGIQNTLVWKGMADSPFFADNLLGMFFHTFTGWTYAATNRYLIPSLQHPDAELLLKTMWMLGAGALVSPLRRISRGEDAIPDDMTPAQHSYEAWQDSGVTSSLGNVLAIANFMSNDKLLGDLKNDKYKNRMKTGIFGMSDVMSSTATRISDVLGMARDGLDEKDLKTAARMLPITGAMYGHYLSDKLIEGLNLPRNKRAAAFENE